MKDSPAKYRRELLRRLPKGYRIGFVTVGGTDERQRARTVGRHPVLLDPDGNAVRAPNGQPVKLSSSPGDHRSLQNDLSSIRRAGVTVS